MAYNSREWLRLVVSLGGILIIICLRLVNRTVQSPALTREVEPTRDVVVVASVSF